MLVNKEMFSSLSIPIYGIEIELPQDGFRNPKPELAIRPRGNRWISTVVSEAAADIVSWNTESIVKVIRGLA